MQIELRKNDTTEKLYNINEKLRNANGKLQKTLGNNTMQKEKYRNHMKSINTD